MPGLLQTDRKAQISLPCNSALKDFPPDTKVTFITINIDLATLVDVNIMYNINDADESQMESLARK